MKKTQDLKDLRGLTIKALYDKLNDSQKEILDLKQDKALGKLKNLHQITVVRKHIAHIMTVIDEKVSENIKEK